MLFSSLIFIFVFLPFVLFLYFVVCRKNIIFQNILLLLASICFYAWGEPKFVLVMIISIMANYIFGILIHKNKKGGGGVCNTAKYYLVIAVAFNLVILFVFKYLNFAVSNIDRIFEDLLPQTHIILPIGISFFTFQAMSYVIDVYRGDAKVQKNIFNVALYISFFPQLIAGPIIRYSDIEKRIISREVKLIDISEGIRRFLIGLSKKVIIANNLAIITDAAFAEIGNGEIPVIFAWLGAISYALQIYFDFDGYSNMAIGLGKMFGFDFPENFIYPYRARTISEFWKYNHISLCTWFRDYVYIPLGGSRKGHIIWLRNMFIVWALTGMWHGAHWTFLVWGIAYFILLVFEKEVNVVEKLKVSAIASFIYRIFTLVCLFILNGVFFRNIGIVNTKSYLLSMFTLNGGIIDNTTILYLCEYKFILIIACIYAFGVFYNIKSYIKGKTVDGIVDVISPVFYMILFIIAISYLVIGAYNPFIYFNF